MRGESLLYFIRIGNSILTSCLFYRFVADNSPSGDMTEGLCAMADAWLADVAFPSFRDSARINPAPTTYEWFERPKIQRFCTRYDMNPGVLRFASSLENFSRGSREAGGGNRRVHRGQRGTRPPRGYRHPRRVRVAVHFTAQVAFNAVFGHQQTSGHRRSRRGRGVGGALIAAGAVNYVQGGSTYVSTSASTSAAGTALRASRRSSDRRLATSATRSSARCSAVGPRPRLTPRLPSRL